MAPVVSNLEKQCANGNVKVVRLNVDVSSNYEQVRKYNVSSIPRFVLVDPLGKVRGDWIGSGAASRFDPVRQQCTTQ